MQSGRFQANSATHHGQHDTEVHLSWSYSPTILGKGTINTLTPVTRQRPSCPTAREQPIQDFN